MDIFNNFFFSNKSNSPREIGDIEKLGIIEDEEKRNRKSKKKLGGSAAPATPGSTSLKGGRATESQTRKKDL